MKKGILLIGPPRSGKSRLANLIADGKKSVTVHFRGSRRTRFNFNLCETDTEVVILDDVPAGWVGDMMFTVPEIKVNKKGQESFLIQPQVIMTSICKRSKLPTGASYTGRFDVIELTDNYNLNEI